MSGHNSDVTQASISLWQSAGSLWRLFRRALRWWVIVLVLLAVAWLIATFITQSAIDTEIAATEARGEPLTLAELAPRIAPGVLNAAPIYESAFSSIPKHDNEDYAHALADPTFARSYLGARKAALSQIRQAANVRDCAFSVDWNQPSYDLTFPHYARMREAVRLLVLDSSLLAADGRADESLDALATAYRVAPHAMAEPVLIGTLVGIAMIRMAHSGLEECLSLGDPSPAACRTAYDELARIDVDTPFRRALLGERASMLGLFEDIRAGRVSIAELSGDESAGFPRKRIFAALYPTLNRPLFNMDEASALDLQRRIIQASDLPWPQSMEALDAVVADSERLPTYRSVLTQMIFPVFARADWSRRNAAAILAVGRAALAIAAFKAQTGHYPDDLSQVEALGWNLPNDPLTGKPLLYRRTADGFTVWGVGPNMKDDGGVEYDSKNMDFTSGPYDITFFCDPQRIAVKREVSKASWDDLQSQKEEAERTAEQTPTRRGRGFRHAPSAR